MSFLMYIDPFKWAITIFIKGDTVQLPLPFQGVMKFTFHTINLPRFILSFIL